MTRAGGTAPTPADPNTREVEIRGHVYTLAATPAEDEVGWTARIVEYSLRAGAAAFQRPVIDARSMLHDQAAIVTTIRATGPSSDGALATLTEQLRSAVEEATRTERTRPRP